MQRNLEKKAEKLVIAKGNNRNISTFTVDDMVTEVDYQGYDNVQINLGR